MENGNRVFTLATIGLPSHQEKNFSLKFLATACDHVDIFPPFLTEQKLNRAELRRWPHGSEPPHLTGALLQLRCHKGLRGAQTM
jgi:hypothetical protein